MTITLPPPQINSHEWPSSLLPPDIEMFRERCILPDDVLANGIRRVSHAKARVQATPQNPTFAATADIPVQFWRIRQVESCTGLKKSMIYLLKARGEFPDSISRGGAQ